MSHEHERSVNVYVNQIDKDLLRKTEKRLYDAISILGEVIMSAIGDFVAKQKEFNDKMGLALEGLTKDIKDLQDKIVELQNSPGEVTPEDQALLDELQTKSGDLTKKMEELDNLTPPVIPPANT